MSETMFSVEDLEWRAPTRADLAAWTTAVAAVEAVDRTGEVFTEEDLGDQLDISFFDAENDGRLLWAPDGTIAAYATVECRPSDKRRRVSLEGAVHPDWRRKGIGRALAEWQIERGEAIGGAADRTLPGWLELFADEHDEIRSTLFESLGFEPLRYFLELKRPLTEPVPDVTLTPDLRLVRFDADRDDATRRAHNEAFLDHWGSSEIDDETWATWVTGHRDFRADLSFVVLDGDQVAGYAINATHRAEWEALGFSEAWTHQLGVRREWRGRGIARALLAASMQAFAEDGLDFAALDVDAENPSGALALYLGTGYERDRTRVLWARQLERLTQE